MDRIIEVEHLSKTFVVPTVRSSTLKEVLLVNFWKPREHRKVHALEDVSFGVEKGRTLGVVGSNGSGKSTLLRILAGAIAPTRGRVAVGGRTGSLIDLPAGLQGDLTGVENIFFNMSLLGVPRREIRRRLDEVTDFADLGYYIHSPIKYYSTGMLLRLAFAIAIHVEPDILLVDEAFAVGDVFYQSKCYERMKQLRRERQTTIILVTHDLEFVGKMCDEVLWLERGAVLYHGSVAAGLNRILLDHHSRLPLMDRMKPVPELLSLMTRGRFGTGEVVIRSVRFVDRQDKETCTFQTGERLTIEMDYETIHPIEQIMCGIGIERTDGIGCGLYYSPADLFAGPAPPRGTIRAVFDPLDLLPGRYQLGIGLSPPGRPFEVYDLYLRLHMLRVIDNDKRGDLPTSAVCRQRAEFSVTGR